MSGAPTPVTFDELCKLFEAAEPDDEFTVVYQGESLNYGQASHVILTLRGPMAGLAALKAGAGGENS